MSQKKVIAKSGQKGSAAGSKPESARPAARADQPLAVAPSLEKGRPCRPKKRLPSQDYRVAGELCRVIDGSYMGFHSADYYKTIDDGERARLRALLDDLAARAGVDAASYWKKSVSSWRIFKACARALAELRERGRPDEQAERLAVSLRAEAARHELARASLDREPTRRRSRRHGPGFYETVRRLDALEQTEGNARQFARLCDTLALWAHFMLTINPGFASTLYATLCDNWQVNRDSLYDGADEDDPRERTTIDFHVETLRHLDELFGARRRFHESDRRRSAEMLTVMRRILAAMSEGIESAAAAQGGTPPCAGRAAMPADATDRLAELRERLRQLDEEDDQTIRCTERFRVEKEIFDIEHPANGGDDEWPDVIGEKEGDA